MADIFGTNLKIGGAWKIDGAILTIENGAELVATDCRLEYRRSLSEYIAINHNARYLISGPGTGSVQIGAIIGPSKDIKQFIDRYTDVCKVAGNTLTIKPTGVVACSDPNDPNNTVTNQVVEFICGGCLMEALQLSISQAGAMSIVTSTFAIKINSLEVK